MKHYLLTIIFIALTGCAVPVDSLQSKKLIASNIVADKNYSIKTQQISYVGQPVIKVKDYKVKTYESKRVRPSHDFKINGPVLYGKDRGYSTNEYYITGTTEIEGREYRVIDFQQSSFQSLGILIDSLGRPYKKILNGASFLIYTYDFEPPFLTFESVEENEIDVTDGYQNYEIIYSGSDDSKIYLTYREFTADDLAKPSFYQDLTYSKTSSNIRFRDLQIEVLEATNEYIKYVVIAD